MTSEEQARFEVLLENIQSNVQMIAEGHVVIVERLERLETKVDALDARVGRLEIRFDVLDARVGRIEDHLGLNGTPTTKRKKK